MYHVSAQGVDERTINVLYYYLSSPIGDWSHHHTASTSRHQRVLMFAHRPLTASINYTLEGLATGLTCSVFIYPGKTTPSAGGRVLLAFHLHRRLRLRLCPLYLINIVVKQLERQRRLGLFRLLQRRHAKSHAYRICQKSSGTGARPSVNPTPPPPLCGQHMT